MSAKYGVAIPIYGDGAPVYTVVTDGKSVEFINGPGAAALGYDYENPDEELSKTFQGRIDVLLSRVPDNDDPDAMLDMINYNMPFELDVSEEYPDMGQALDAAKQRQEENAA